MFTISHKVFVGVCVLVGLVSAVFAALTTMMVDPTLAYFGWATVAGLVLASGWGVCALVRNQLSAFTMAATMAFAASVLFQLVTSFYAIVHLMSPEIFIFIVTGGLLSFGIEFVVGRK